MGELLHRIEERKNFTNIASWVGHGAVRIAVLGMENRKPTAGELSQMKKLVLQALEEGAFGLSSGPIYPRSL
jgi:N-acyl-D-aspartate/D-glutamate deacylase